MRAKSHTHKEPTMLKSATSRSIRALVMLALAVTMTAALSACNTMSGLGRDTQRAGEALEDQAEDTKN